LHFVDFDLNRRPDLLVPTHGKQLFWHQRLGGRLPAWARSAATPQFGKGKGCAVDVDPTASAIWSFSELRRHLGPVGCAAPANAAAG
jgi:hypothetical protein